MEGIETNKIYHGDCLSILKTLPDNSINCCITSPPYYGLRDYGVNEQRSKKSSKRRRNTLAKYW